MTNLSKKALIGLKHILTEYGIFINWNLIKDQKYISDLNESFELIVDWMMERYCHFSKPSYLIKLALKIYDKLYFLEDLIHKNVRSIRKIITNKKPSYTNWPVDDTVYILKESLKDCIIAFLLRRFNFVPMVAKWPYPYNSAMIITHDVDKNLTDEFLKIIQIEKKYNIRSTWNFIADSRYYKLKPKLLKNILSKGFEIGCHGLYHDRLFNIINQFERKIRIFRSKKIIETITGKKNLGFRTPLLDRTNDLWELLENYDYLYDSSYPDVDHLSTFRRGMGVSMNIPYNAIIEKNNIFKEVKLIELPVSAPQDVELIIDKKLTEEKAFEIYKNKSNNIISKEGLLNYIFHPNILKYKNWLNFYDSLLNYFRRKENLWITTAEQVVNWWNLRKGIKMSIKNNNLMINSENDVKDVIIKILYLENEKIIHFKLLKRFETVKMRI